MRKLFFVLITSLTFSQMALADFETTADQFQNNSVMLNDYLRDLQIQLKNKNPEQQGRIILSEAKDRELSLKISSTEFQIARGSGWCTEHPEGTALGYAYHDTNVVYLCEQFFNTLYLMKNSVPETDAKQVEKDLTQTVLLHEILHTVGYSHGVEMYETHSDLLLGTSIRNAFQSTSHPDLAGWLIAELKSEYDSVSQLFSKNTAGTTLPFTHHPSGSPTYTVCNMQYFNGDRWITGTPLIFSNKTILEQNYLDIFVGNLVDNYMASYQQHISSLILRTDLKPENVAAIKSFLKNLNPIETSSDGQFRRKVTGFDLNLNNGVMRISDQIRFLNFLTLPEAGNNIWIKVDGDNGIVGVGRCH